MVAEYRRVCAEAREIASPYALDDLVLHNRRGPLTLRWLYLHMIEEVARHAGHADILREQVLAADRRWPSPQVPDQPPGDMPLPSTLVG